jgi:hypothetical protein
MCLLPTFGILCGIFFLIQYTVSFPPIIKELKSTNLISYPVVNQTFSSSSTIEWGKSSCVSEDKLPYSNCTTILVNQTSLTGSCYNISTKCCSKYIYRENYCQNWSNYLMYNYKIKRINTYAFTIRVDLNVPLYFDLVLHPDSYMNLTSYDCIFYKGKIYSQNDIDSLIDDYEAKYGLLILATIICTIVGAIVGVFFISIEIRDFFPN